MKQHEALLNMGNGPAGRIIGIDLGTTNSVMAIHEGGRTRIIPNREGGNLTPSVVSFSHHLCTSRKSRSPGAYLVGKKARAAFPRNPEGTLFSVKRKMGSSFCYDAGGSLHTPVEISALILKKLKDDAEKFLGEEVSSAVITVPAYFNENQRQATREAGALAGWKVERIINEPTAAALAYGLDRDEPHTILVWDLGGGTFDVSILELGEGIFRVRAVSGNAALGGDDWDVRVAEFLAEKFSRRTAIDLMGDPSLRPLLVSLAEKAKKDLSVHHETTVTLPMVPHRLTPVVPIGENRLLELSLTMGDFEAATKDLLEKLIPPTEQALADADLAPEDLHRILLVGGATRMPCVAELARCFFRQEPYQKINPDEIVAVGAALQGALLRGELDGVTLVDVTPLSLGIGTRGGLFTRLIRRNSVVPCSVSRLFTAAFTEQDSVEIHVLQGEREMARDNISLGHFTLSLPSPTPYGAPRIEVSFSLDASGLLEVRAQDLYSEELNSVRFDSRQKLSHQKLQEILEEAEIKSLQDSREREATTLKKICEDLIASLQTSLQECNDRQDKKLRRKIRQLIAQLREGISSRSLHEMRRRLREAKSAIETLQCEQPAAKLRAEGPSAPAASSPASGKEHAALTCGPSLPTACGWEGHNDKVATRCQDKEEEAIQC